MGASVPGGSASYLYDQDGKRVKQTIGANVTNFLWDTQSAYGDVTLETDGSNVITANYTIGQGCPVCDVSGLLSQNKGGVVSYFLKDGQGSVRNLTNSSGAITENYRYDAFGNLQGFSGTPNTKYLYTGQQFDQLTGLYDLRARYYNPNQGRFLSRDMASVNFNNPKELNRYGYAANNPTNRIDPTGYNAAGEYVQLTFEDNKETPAETSLGFAVGDEIAVVLAEEEAPVAYEILEDAYAAVGRPSRPALAVGKGTYVTEEGETKGILTVNNAYGDINSQITKENLKVIDYLSELAKKNGWEFEGMFQEGATQETALHAEDNVLEVVNRLKSQGTLAPNSRVTVGISRKGGFCNRCLQNYENFGDALRIIDEGIRILIGF